MPNFVTFDDGLNYISITEIHSFGYEGGPNKGGQTWIKLRTGERFLLSWSVEQVAEMLGPVVNLHY